MKNVLKYLGVVVALVFAVSLISCAPNKSMTRGSTLDNGDIGGVSSEKKDESFSYDDNETLGAESAPKVASSAGSEGFVAASGSTEDEFSQTGLASWYGREFHGRKTASGEQFNMYELTAAHKTYPFGTLLLVKSLESGKSVKVRINDRGPYKDKRVIDLSYAAAKSLGILGAGEAMVGIKVLGSGEAEESSVAEVAGRSDYVEETASSGYDVQAGAFYSARNADKLKAKLESTFTNEIVVAQEDDMFKVRITGFKNRNEAERCKSRLLQDNINSFIVTKE